MKNKNKTVICIDLDGKKYKVPKNKLTFRPSVYGIIIKENKVLLVKQWDGYDIPGGGVNIGETLEDALKREVFEETGYTVKMGCIIHTQCAFFKPPFRDRFVESILLYYKAEVIGGKISLAHLDEDEKKYADMPKWVEISQIKNLKFYNPINNEKIIRRAL